MYSDTLHPLLVSRVYVTKSSEYDWAHIYGLAPAVHKPECPYASYDNCTAPLFSSYHKLEENYGIRQKWHKTVLQVWDRLAITNHYEESLKRLPQLNAGRSEIDYNFSKDTAQVR